MHCEFIDISELFLDILLIYESATAVLNLVAKR